MAFSDLVGLPAQLKLSRPWLADAKFFDVVDSTQARIEASLQKNVNGCVLLLAERQTKGVGRQGRPWVSQPGGVWLTLAFPADKRAVPSLAPFSLVSALAVLEALRETYNIKADLKWPNDVLVNKAKIAGILLSTAERFKRTWLLLGIGVNVNNDLPADLSTATSVKAIKGVKVGRAMFLEYLMDRLWLAWEEFTMSGFGPFFKAYQDNLQGMNEPVSLQLGTVTVKGTLRGVDPRGGLQVQSAASIRTIHAGEILA